MINQKPKKVFVDKICCHIKNVIFGIKRISVIYGLKKFNVILGLDPRIQQSHTWIPRSSRGMTKRWLSHGMTKRQSSCGMTQRCLSHGMTKIQLHCGMIFLFVILTSFISSAFANGGEVPIKLEHVKIDVQDKASLLRGAKFYANNCMACHTMKYLQHNKIAQQAGITLDKMPLKVKEWWLGIVPPDLTLIVNQEGADWVYTYLHSFYKDSSRPTGYNNILVKNVNMMNILAPYQGQQELTAFGKRWLAKKHYHLLTRKPPYYRVLIRVQSGSMSQEQYDKTMTDLVNFLTYAGEPNRVQREHLGFWVLLFLAVLFVFAYLLKKSYWKDV